MELKLKIGNRYVTRSGIITPPLKSSRTNSTHKFTAWVQDPESSAGLIQPAWNEAGKVAAFWDAAKWDLAKEYGLK